MIKNRLPEFRCEDCKYFFDIPAFFKPHHGGGGECRLLPPIFVSEVYGWSRENRIKTLGFDFDVVHHENALRESYRFPIVSGQGDWCSFFKKVIKKKGNKK